MQEDAGSVSTENEKKSVVTEENTTLESASESEGNKDSSSKMNSERKTQIIEETQEEDEELKARRENLNLDSETALLETVLFLESEPQNSENLAKITKFSIDVVNECIERLKEKYLSEDSGITLAQIIGGWVLVPKKECFDFVKERYGKKNEGKLSKSAMETLSIIAYLQPITRSEIEAIRGVSADNMIRLLIAKNLIKEVGKNDAPGKPTQFGTTKDFLKLFQLNSISDLPKLEEKESERFELAR